MSKRQLKLFSQQPNGTVWADSSDPNYTVRFKTSSAPKILDGQRTMNHVTEIIVNDTSNVTIGAKVVPDALSVRVRASGSTEAQPDLAQALRDVAAQLDTWIGEDVLLGFAPGTAPERTVE